MHRKLSIAWPAGSLLLAVALPVSGSEAPVALGEVTVTGTREARLVAETPASVGTITGETLRDLRPTHPKDALNGIPGVWVSNLSGEGHSTAIRQPLTTGAVYLYLEDGIPTRSTGFFNHNALYEINVPQSGGVEITKGPGSALYGSDAIGGTVNVLTRTPPRKAEAELSGETGANGWGRLLVSGGNAHGDDAWRGSLNLTRSDGWHEQAGYERQSGNLRWDRALAGDALLKTVFAFSRVDQQHVGNLSPAELAATPRHNNIPFSYRKVDALRLSAAYEKETADSLLSITPYLRDNRMEIVPSWTVSYDPNRYVTENQSFGVLAKYRQDFVPWRARLIVGLDVDYSPGSRDEDSLALTRSRNALGGTDYALDPARAAVRIYRYDVTYRGISPYVHGEVSPTERLRLTAGLRYDDMQYDYVNRFNEGAPGATQGAGGNFPGGGWYGHAGSARVSYHHLGPRLGATYAFTPQWSGFAAYSNSFRAPSEGQVFRGSREATAARAQAAAESLLALRPVVVDNYEIGVRGKQGAFHFEAALYHMTKKDDIVSYTDPLTAQRTVVNTGKTLHRGVELGVGVALAETLRLDASLSYTRHTYAQWTVSGTADYSGRDMESAPRRIASTRLTYRPALLRGGRLRVEWFHLGSYWIDAGNTARYAGHNLVHLGLTYPLARDLEGYANIANLFDKHHAETAGGTAAAPTYTVGLPRTVIVGVQKTW